MSKDDQTLPPAPKHEGVDPLTDGHTYYGEDVKGASERLASEENQQAETRAESGEPTEDQAEQADMVQDQEERAADPAGAKE